MTNDFDNDLTWLMGKLDNVPAAHLPGPAAARQRGEARTRHQAIGGTFAAMAVGAVAAAVAFGQPSFLAGPEPAEPTPTEQDAPEPTPEETPVGLTAIPDGAMLRAADIWDYGGTEPTDWHQHDLDSPIYECVPDRNAIDARDRQLIGYTNSAEEGDPDPDVVVVHDLYLLEPGTAGTVFAELQEMARGCAPILGYPEPSVLDDSPVEGVGDDAWIFRYLESGIGHFADEPGDYVTIGLVRVGDLLSVTVRRDVNTEADKPPDYMTPAVAAGKVCRIAMDTTCIGDVEAASMGWYPVTIDGEDAPDPERSAGSEITQAQGWQLEPAPGGFQVGASIVAADGTVVALYRETVWLSSDGGTSWQGDASVDISTLDENSLGGQWSEIAIDDDGMLVAAGTSFGAERELPIAMRSTDNGQTWTGSVPSTPDGAGRMEAVTWADGEFVAVGASGAGNQPAATVWTSPDGVSWQPTVLDTESLGGVVGTFTDVLVGPDGRVLAPLTDSPYLVTWQAQDASDAETVELPTEVSTVVRAPSGYYALGQHLRADGNDGVLLRSQDGLSWEIDPRSDALADTLGGNPGHVGLSDIHVGADGSILIGGASYEIRGQVRYDAGMLWRADSPDSPLERVATELFQHGPGISDLIDGPSGLLAVGPDNGGYRVWREVGD